MPSCITPKIITTPICPPIPDRSHDWCAYVDGREEEGNYGYGRTEIAALADLTKALFGDVDQEAVNAIVSLLRKHLEQHRKDSNPMEFSMGYLRAISDLEDAIL